MRRLRWLTLRFPEEYVEALRILVDAGMYNSVNEAIRNAVRLFIMQEHPLLASLPEKSCDSDSGAQVPWEIGGPLRNVSFGLPDQDYRAITELVRSGKYKNVSEFVKKALYILIEEHKALDQKVEAMRRS